MRKMYDSTTAADLPLDSELVAGYIDGTYKWSDADWARFPTKVKVRIAVLASTDDGHVLDVETGDATPDQAPRWVQLRRARGVEPTVYCNLSNVDAIKAAFAAQGVALPHFWLAHYDNDPTLPAGYVAKQYANEALTGGHYDASVVADTWPGVDTMPKFQPPPLFSQSDDLTLKVGEVGEVAAQWSYKQPDGTYKEKAVIRKVWSQTPRRWVYTLLPPVDPEADPTECLDGPPAVWIINVSALP